MLSEGDNNEEELLKLVLQYIQLMQDDHATNVGGLL